MKLSITYKDLKAGQNKYIYESFPLLLNYKPSKIIELGTGVGGFTIWLKDLFGCDIYTYDITEREQKELREKLFKEKGIHYKICNIFQNKDEIIDLIDEKTIVICDNGNKKEEFKTFSKYLHKGSLIMIHDYAKSREYFEKEIKDKIWRSLEFDGSEFEDYCQRFGLEPYLQNEFDKSVWFIRRKK